MGIKYPCSICKGSVHSNHKAIQCDVCQLWVHIKCNHISISKYKEYQKENEEEEGTKNTKEAFFCSTCFNEVLPFGNENDNVFSLTNVNGINAESNIENFDITLNKETKEKVKQISQLILENTDPDNENDKFCDYFSAKKFKKLKPRKESTFSIFHLNIASLQYHIDDLKTLLNMLEHNFDIIAISETKIQTNVPPTIDISIPSYDYEHTSTEANKGGTLIYISNKHNYKPRPDLEIYESKRIESTFVEIVNPNGKNTIIGTIYKHHTMSQKEFNFTLQPLLKKLTKENKLCYLTGDFNMNLLSMNKDKDVQEFFDNLTDKKFMPLIKIPTRIAKNSKTLIDNIFFNQFSNNIVSGNLTVGISDHLPQFSIIPIETKSKTNQKRNVYKRNFCKFDLQNFKKDLSRETDTLTDLRDVNKYTESFIHITERLLDKYAPVKKLTKKQVQQKQKPWIGFDIIKKINIKDKMYKKLINEDDQTRKEQLTSEYKKQKNDITKLIRQSKKIYYQAYFEKNSRNLKKLWEGVNTVIRTKTRTPITISYIETEVNKMKVNLTEPYDIANLFNDFYINVAEKILEKRKYPGNKHFTHYLHTNNPHSFLALPTTPNEIEDLIALLNENKSTGPNSIPNKIIKQISDCISVPISDLCNNSFVSGIYPEILKCSKVIPIHKKDSKLDVANYRPISLLSNINKILEKLMFNRLLKFLEMQNCIYELQFGFRKQHSTNHALLSMTQQIKDAIDDGNMAVGIFVDFQKAFDTVNHEILLKKLEHYGIRGIVNKWFASYLNHRKQYVTIDDTDSKIKTIKHGVPQGSVLGPLLFLIYINDLHICIKNSTTRHFADDTNLLYIINGKRRNRNKLRKLNIDLEALDHWLPANKISLNSTKTEVLFFRKKGTEVPNNTLRLNGVKLANNSTIKYVGITFDEYLTFHEHREILHSKLKRANNLLAICRHYIPKELLMQIYYSQFYSRLSYGCQLWGLNENDNLKLITLQKKAVRLLSFAHFQAHSEPLFNDLKILKLSHIVKLNNIIFTHNILNKKAPEHFNNFFEIYERQHTHNTTNKLRSDYSIPDGSLVLPKINSQVGKKNIKYACAETWNSVIKELGRKNPSLVSSEFWLKDVNTMQIKSLLKTLFLQQ